MTTSVKLDEQDKKKLDRLQAKLTLGLGERPSQQEILGALISKALKDEKLLDSLEKWRPLTDEEFRRLLSLSSRWGVQTSWKEIDSVLYGKPSGER